MFYISYIGVLIMTSSLVLIASVGLVTASTQISLKNCYWCLDETQIFDHTLPCHSCYISMHYLKCIFPWFEWFFSSSFSFVYTRAIGSILLENTCQRHRQIGRPLLRGECAGRSIEHFFDSILSTRSSHERILSKWKDFYNYNLP